MGKSNHPNHSHVYKYTFTISNNNLKAKAEKHLNNPHIIYAFLLFSVKL